jgi:predicted transcriptional regulator
MITPIAEIMKGLIKLGLSMVSLLFLGTAIFLHIYKGFPFLYVPAACALLITAISFRALRNKPAQVKASASKYITMEQVNTLLRISDNRITAKRLSSATNTPLEIAEKYLHDLVIEGKLEVEAGEQELIYIKG